MDAQAGEDERGDNREAVVDQPARVGVELGGRVEHRGDLPCRLEMRCRRSLDLDPAASSHRRVVADPPVFDREGEEPTEHLDGLGSRCPSAQSQYSEVAGLTSLRRSLTCDVAKDPNRAASSPRPRSPKATRCGGGGGTQVPRSTSARITSISSSPRLRVQPSSGVPSVRRGTLGRTPSSRHTAARGHCLRTFLPKIGTFPVQPPPQQNIG